jgi:hypothetical protein
VWRRESGAVVRWNVPQMTKPSSHATECEGCRPDIVRGLRLEQCARCRMLGCDRGPGFVETAFAAPSMWRCMCRCHPINHTDAADFLSEHVSANHGRVVTSTRESPDSFECALLVCDCGESAIYDAGAVPAFVPDPRRWDGIVQ